MISKQLFSYSFDSESNHLKVSTDISGTDLTQKSIEDSEKNDLIGTITKNNFFNTEGYVCYRK